MTEINSFSDIVRRWGKPAKLADQIGAKPNTVSKWGQRDFIPCEWWVDIERASGGTVTVGQMAGLAAARRVV